MPTNNNHWTTDEMPDLSGKTAVVTGANSGIGFDTARALADKGAHVVLACRSADKGQAAAEAIQAENPDASLAFMALDLADLASVRTFAAAFARAYEKLDILVNNAGVMAIPQRRETADGFEMQFGTNHLGHFALTGLLLDRLLAADAARVVTVSSSAERMGSIDFEDLNWEQTYSPWSAYGRSKQANILFALEFQRRLEAAGAGAISVAVHPGYAATNLQSSGPALGGSTLASRFMSLTNRIVAQSSAMGALPSLYGATDADINGGDFLAPGGLFNARGYPTRINLNGRYQDEALARDLWEVSEKLTGIEYSALNGHKKI
jgi:NAD(P)-dependent dehydrogenase (short-subunit alcohol dehydrogenase family)